MLVSTPKVIGVSEPRSEKKVQKSPPPLEAGDVHQPPASKVGCSMMLDAYQHTSGTCYRNYHGQNDFIYDFTASQTLEGHISSISHRAVLGRYTMLVHYWVEYFLYFFKFPTWSICSKVDISTLPMIPATLFIQNRTWVTTTLVQHDVSG